MEKVAGYVEDYLEWAEEATVQEIVEEVDVPQPVVLMGVGYLASEGRVDFKDREDYTVELV